jgi:hypothetical protein
MDIQESLTSLNELCRGKEWFYDAVPDEFGRIVVYVNQIGPDVTQYVPDSIDGRQVLVHFASSYLAKKDKFINNLSSPAVVDDPEDEEDNTPIGVLINKLDKLEKICGSNILQDIFYEVHDGKNSVTNLSIKYPEIRKSLEELYEVFGFDVIYEELDG